MQSWKSTLLLASVAAVLPNLGWAVSLPITEQTCSSSSNWQQEKMVGMGAGGGHYRCMSQPSGATLKCSRHAQQGSVGIGIWAPNPGAQHHTPKDLYPYGRLCDSFTPNPQGCANCYAQHYYQP